MWKLPASEVEPVAFRRRGARRVIREDATASAAQMIGQLVEGDEVSGVTNGQFSMIDILDHLLSLAGPSRQIFEGLLSAEPIRPLIRPNPFGAA